MHNSEKSTTVLHNTPTLLDILTYFLRYIIDISHRTGIEIHGRKFKISKILNFQNYDLKTCNMPTNYSQFEDFKWSIVLRQTECKSENL